MKAHIHKNENFLQKFCQPIVSTRVMRFLGFGFICSWGPFVTRSRDSLVGNKIVIVFSSFLWMCACFLSLKNGKMPYLFFHLLLPLLLTTAKDDELQENDYFSYRQHSPTRIWNSKEKPRKFGNRKWQTNVY